MCTFAKTYISSLTIPKFIIKAGIDQLFFSFSRIFESFPLYPPIFSQNADIKKFSAKVHISKNCQNVV